MKTTGKIAGLYNPADGLSNAHVGGEVPRTDLLAGDPEVAAIDDVKIGMRIPRIIGIFVSPRPSAGINHEGNKERKKGIYLSSHSSLLKMLT